MMVSVGQKLTKKLAFGQALAFNSRFELVVEKTSDE